MWRHCVLVIAGLGVIRTEAYAPIRWATSSGPCLTPKGFSGYRQALVPPQKLVIGDHLEDVLPEKMPFFTARPDKTITWDDVGWCIEAEGNRDGDAVLVNRCSGKAEQRWNWVSDGRGGSMIQLEGTSKCLASKEGTLNGAPVELRTCNLELESWRFQDPSSMLARKPSESPGLGSKARQGMTALFALIGVGVVSLSALHWRRRTNACLVGQDRLSLNVEDGGVSLAAHQSKCRISSIKQSQLHTSGIWDTGSRSRHDIPRMSISDETVPPDQVIVEAESQEHIPHVAVVGGGWGGWGAAKALVENGCRVTLLDAVPDPTGRTPFLTPTGKPFEAGTRGFWFDYPNINALVNNDLGLEEEQVFTEFTKSSFYSPDGLEATAPVFSQSEFPTLPSPLGQVAATFSLFERIPVPDRVTMVGLLLAMLDYTRDEETFEAYDRMSANQLFNQMNISPRLVRDFIKPTLLVGLFKSPEELSAAVSMELLYFYALAHQTSFDVRWIKSRSISELIVAPLAEKLAKETAPVHKRNEGDDADESASETPLLTVLGGSFVKSIHIDESSRRVSGLTYVDRKLGESKTLDDLDGCVLSLGAKGMKAVMGSSKQLAKVAPELCLAASLDSIDVIAVRLWLDKTVTTRTPANVFSRFEALRGAGGTFFMLDQLQNQDPSLLWGEDEVQGSVVACDFYNAGALLPLSDEEIVRTLMEDLLPAAVPAFAQAVVVDSYVLRCPGAVTWFSPGSYTKRPPLQTSVENLVCAGDWVRLGDRETKAKGLCQERAYISGLEAANALARSGILGSAHTGQHEVIEIRDDEPQVVAGRQLNQSVASILKPFGLTPNPLARPNL